MSSNHHYQAPAAATAAADPAEGNLRIWSCVTCRRRKVKCDRRDPCANCVRNRIECHFPVTGRLPRRSRDPATNRASPSQRQGELLGRLRRLEDLVTELSGQLEDGAPGAGAQVLQSGLGPPRPPASASGGGTPLTAGTEMYEDFGRLVVDQGSGPRVDRGFWSIFCDEVQHIFEAIGDGSDEPEPPRRDKYGSDDPAAAAHCHGYILGTPCAPIVEEDLLYPLPSQVPFLWRTYVDNVDPFIKILHVPSVEAIITQSRGKLNHHGPNIQALLSAVCLAAIVSLDADEVSDSFRVSKNELVPRLRLKTERALGHAQFATTKDITVVQALAVYLFTLPHIGAGELAFNLTGVLVRIATSMGLHRDPLAEKSQYLDSIDLDAETRRRAWWHVVFLSSRSRAPGAPGGGTISEDSFTTRVPTNVDDQSLAGTPAAVTTSSNTMGGDHRRLTPTTLAIIRCEIWRLRNSLRRSREQPLDLQLRKLHVARENIKGTYLPSDQPTAEPAFASFLAAITALFFAKIEAGICRHHLRRTRDDGQVSSPARDRFFAASVAVIQATRDLCSPNSQAWDRWRWQLQGSFPWRAVGCVFIQLCQLPWTPVSKQAWELARGLFEGLPDESRGEAMWQRLSELASNAAVHPPQQIEGQAGDATGIGTGWSLSHQDKTGTRVPYAANAAGDVPAETAAVAEWEWDMSAAEEVLRGWLDWDDIADMDTMF